MSDLARRAALALLLSLLGCSDSPTDLPDASRDRIVFVSDASGNYDIYAIDQDGSNRVQLTSAATPELQPAPSPDGSRIAFVSADRGVGLAEIFVMNSDGTGAIQITGLPGQFPGLATMPSWSPEGLRILFTGFLGGMGEGDLFVMNADGGDWVNLTNDDLVRDEYGAWSPSGRQIAFVRWVVVGNTAHPYIHVMNADGSGVRQLTSGDVYDLWPAWSPDSRRIVFARQTAGGATSRIYTISSTGTGLRALTDDQGLDSEPSWSRDGNRLLFSSSREGSTWVDTEIWTGRGDGANGANVTRTPPDTDFNPHWLVVP